MIYHYLLEDRPEEEDAGAKKARAEAETRQQWAQAPNRLLPGAPLAKGRYHVCCTVLPNGKTFSVTVFCKSKKRGEAVEHELFHNEC